MDNPAVADICTTINFDPAVVDVFVATREQFSEIAARCPDLEVAA